MNICMMSLMMTSAFGGPDYAIEKILEVAKASGMGSIDWIGLHNTTARELKQAGDAAGVPVSAHTMLKEGFLHDDPNYLDEFKASLEDACVLGAPVLMLPPFARLTQSSQADDRQRYIEYYGKAAELAKAANVTLTLESTGFLHSPITTADECLEVLHAVPDLRITFDVGNVFTAEDPRAAFRKLRKFVVHFHAKDWLVSDVLRPGYLLRRNGKYMTETLLGDGAVNLRAFWQMLTPEERRLWINPESCDFSWKLSPLEGFRKITAVMRSWE